MKNACNEAFKWKLKILFKKKAIAALPLYILKMLKQKLNVKLRSIPKCNKYPFDLIATYDN